MSEPTPGRTSPLPDPAGRPAVRRKGRSFGPTVLAGLAGAGLAAVASSRTWASAAGDAAGIKVSADVSGAEVAPLAAALALVALASWGVVLVTRARTRRIVAAVGLVSAVGSLAAVVVGLADANDQAVAAVVARGASEATASASLAPWILLAGLGALLTAAALAVAVRVAGGWPAMGSKYDAPASRTDRPSDEQDMWRALDEGHDPTA